IDLPFGEHLDTLSTGDREIDLNPTDLETIDPDPNPRMFDVPLERLHAEEQEQFTDAEKAKLFMKFIERRRKFFAAKRDEEKRKKPPTNAQQRSIMTTYLKNMDGWKPKALKNKSIADIKELFDKAMERINSFVDFKTELVEEKRSKKQKIEDVNESAKLKRCLEIVPDDGDEVTIDATPLSSKSPTIVDYKIYKEWRKSFF
nr:hypothetical protein [Tanacetum cinerariifolium]